MKKKFLSFVLALCFIVPSSLVFVGCGDKVDPKLYSITFKCNLEGVETTQSAVLVYPTRDEDEASELIKAGATQADIDKAGKLQDDGKYYFFDQDPVYLYTTELTGYKFEGFYVEGENRRLDYMPNDYDNDGVIDAWWNMENKDLVLVATYSLCTYTILYMDEGTNAVDNCGNQTTWKVTDGEKTLNHTDIDHKTFGGWSTTVKGHMVENVTKLNGQLLEAIDCAHEDCSIALHAKYSDILYDVEFAFDSSILMNVIIERETTGRAKGAVDKDGNFTSGGDRFIDEDFAGKCIYGDEITIIFNFNDTFDNFKSTYGTEGVGIYNSSTKEEIVSVNDFTVNDNVVSVTITVTGNISMYFKYPPLEQ